MKNKIVIITLMFMTSLLFGCTKNEYIFPNHISTKQIYGEEVVYNDLVGSISASKVGTHAPIFDENEFTYYMDDPINPLDEDYIFVSLQLPHNYKTNSNLSCHLHAYEKTRSALNYTLELNYTWYNINEVNGVTYSITKNFILNNPSRNNSIIDFGYIDGRNKTISSTFKAKITRKFNDNATNNIYLDFFDCHYQQDTIGSFGWFTK